MLEKIELIEPPIAIATGMNRNSTFIIGNFIFGKKIKIPTIKKKTTACEYYTCKHHIESPNKPVSAKMKQIVT
jgi:hypothetical protein